MQDNFSYVVVVTFIRCFSFLCLFLFVCFCLSPKKVMHRCDPTEWGEERQAKLFYHSDTFSALFVYNYAAACIVYN